MFAPRARLPQRRAGAATLGFSLVEMLVVLVVLGLLAGLMFTWYTGKGGAKGVAGKPSAVTPKEAASGVECRSNLSQLRQAYTMATATGDEQRPQKLADLKPFGVTESIARCPVGKEWYVLDPQGGRIRCAHPGHENF